MKHRIEPDLPRRPAICCRCGQGFATEINPEIRGDFGEIIRGERQVFRLCPGCRADGSKSERRDRRRQDAHATS